MTLVRGVEEFLGDQARRHRRSLVFAAAASAGATAAAGLLLGLSGWFLAAASLAGLAGPLIVQSFNYLPASAGFRLFAILRTAGRYGERLKSHEVALHALAALRPALFAGLAAAPPEQSLRLSTGEAATRLVQDVEALETRFVQRATPWAAAAAGLAATLLTALASPWAGALFLIALAAQLLIGRALAQTWTRAPARQALEAAGRLGEGVNAYAAAAAELRAFRLTQAAIDALMVHDADLGGANLRQADAEAALALLEALPLAVCLFSVALICRHAPLPLAALAVLSVPAGFEGAAGFVRAAEQAGGYRAAVARLDAMIGVARPPATPPPPTADLSIDGERLAPGERVALTGPSGCGKTRTLEALLGLREAPLGRLRIADRALETAPTGWARALFAYAPQNARLITGTIAENLRLADPDADETTLWRALQDAGLDRRVRRMTSGLDTWIGDGGETLSGGEQRRLALARAYIRPAPWLVLDEPTEGLDVATEAAVVAALDERLRRGGQGLLLVTHRTAPLALCPRSIALSANNEDMIMS